MPRPIHHTPLPGVAVQPLQDGGVERAVFRRGRRDAGLLQHVGRLLQLAALGLQTGLHHGKAGMPGRQREALAQQRDGLVAAALGDQQPRQGLAR
jgi:hypothetical protein